MNKTLENTARILLKELLNECTEPQQFMFKRMYSHKNLELTISDAVDQMDESKIDVALSQVERTIEKTNMRK
jgi:hypothetical protein